MDKELVIERARELESALRGLKSMKLTTSDKSGLRDSEKYILLMLATLNDGKPVMPSEVAKKLDVTLAAITHHINSLEEHGLVSRAASPDDRRVVLVSLSEKGSRLAGVLKKSYWKKTCGLVEFLGDKDSAELVTLMTKISAFAKKAGDR